jgi:ParB family chromosome partitioning protein
LARKAENEDATVASWPAPANTEGEFHENEIRKDFTPSERVAIGLTLEGEIGERRGRPSKSRANAREFTGETADHVAAQTGFGSRET